jgi:hypothetical protein
MLFASLQTPETFFNEITDKVGCVWVPSLIAPGTCTTDVTTPVTRTVSPTWPFSCSAFPVSL